MNSPNGLATATSTTIGLRKPARAGGSGVQRGPALSPGLLRGEWAHAVLSADAECDAERFCQQHGLPRKSLREPLCRVTLDHVSQALLHTATLRNDPLLGIHRAARRRPRGLLHYLMSSQADFGVALEQLVRCKSLLLTGHEIALQKTRNECVLNVWPCLAEDHRQVVEASLAILCLDLAEMTETPLCFERVHLRGAALAAPSEYESVFGCPVRFRQAANALVMRVSDLRLRMRRSNALVADHLARMARQELRLQGAESMRERVALVVKAALKDNEARTLDAVARRLACSPRGLQRALDIEATSFRDIEDGARRDLALALVAESDVPLAQVAERAGFAEKSSFTKAFKRWTGRSPSEYRSST